MQMLKHALTGTGLAIGATLLSAAQAFAVSFTIDSFNVQFGPGACTTTITPTTTCTTNQPLSPASPPTLRVGSFTGAYTTGTIDQVTPLPGNQVIGGERTMTLNQITTGASGISRLLPAPPNNPSNWQIFNTNGSRVSSSMIWDRIDPNLPVTDSASGKFLDRLRGRGALAFQALSIPAASSPIFTFIMRDQSNNEVRAVKSGIVSTPSNPRPFVVATFEEFLTTVGSNFNFNAVKYVELNIQMGGPSSSTIQIDFVQGFEIPEPSLVLGSVIAFGVGFLSMKGRVEEADEN